ncbi:MAG: hypothetical protein WBF83_06720 [Moheibacter sp.]
MTLQEKIDYIGRDKFVKITNTEEFPDLSKDLRELLKEIGIYSNRKGYPYLTTDGKLKRFNDSLIQFGEGVVGDPFCIDIKNKEKIVGYDLDSKNIRLINTSIVKYIECIYELRYYTNEIEGFEKFGPYHKNHKKYAKEFQKMLEKIEPKAMEYPTWGGRVYEMDLGVI